VSLLLDAFWIHVVLFAANRNAHGFYMRLVRLFGTVNVVLTNHQANFIEQLVSSGRYQNASEVLREGLRLIEQREADDASRLVALRSAVTVGIADFNQAQFMAFDTSEALGAHLNSFASKANDFPR
jgi:antitoxin ParD1/3/4